MTMSPTPPIPPVELAQAVPTPPAETMDAFRAALHSAGAAIYANPDMLGHGLMSGIDRFHSSEIQMRSALTQSVGGGATVGPASPTDVASAVNASDLAAKPTGMGSLDATLEKGQEMQRHSMGVMMQTYSFALEATLVNSAATTFTSSVNTLIKTQ